VDRTVSIARKLGTAAHQRLRGGDEIAEWNGVAERLGTRESRIEEVTLHSNARGESRRPRPQLDHRLATVAQPQPDNHGEMSGAEQRGLRRRAEVLLAPRCQRRTVDQHAARYVPLSVRNG